MLHAIGSRYLGEHIPGAKTVELPGDCYFPHLGDQDAITGEIEHFLTGVRPPVESDRSLATVLFTDIVGSTEHAAAIGRSALDGDPRPARRSSCVRNSTDIVAARSTRPATGCSQPLTVPHAACDVRRPFVVPCARWGSRFGRGSIPARWRFVDTTSVASRCTSGRGSLGWLDPVRCWCRGPSRILVAGSGIEFADRGEHVLKGVPGQWTLFAVTG